MVNPPKISLSGDVKVALILNENTEVRIFSADYRKVKY